MVNSRNVRIPIELDEVIVETIKSITPLFRKLNILGKEEELSYIAACRMVALKFRQYTMPFTPEIIQELKKLTDENGGKHGKFK